MRKILSLITVLVMVLSVAAPTAVMAEDVTNTVEGYAPSDTGGTTYTLSLEEAISLAMEDNPRIVANAYVREANRINIKSASLTRSSTDKAIKKAGELGIQSATTIEELCVRKGYYVRATQVQYDLSVIEKSRIEASIAYNTTNAYYNLVLMDMLVNAAQNSYNLALENMSVVDAQYKQGLVAQMDYNNADISVDSAKSLLDGYILNRNIARMTLANQLNLDINSEFVLTDSIESEEFLSDVEADVRNALESRYEIIAAGKQVELAREYMVISRAFTESSAVYNSAYADFVNAEYQYKTAADGVELSVRAAHNTFTTNYTAVGIARRTYEMRLSEYDAAKLRYDLGIITNLELTDKINALYEAQVSLSQAELNYTMSVEKYKYDISVGLAQ